MDKILTYIGKDDWDRPVYKSENGNLYCDVNLGEGTPKFCTKYRNEFYGEPDLPMPETWKPKIIRKIMKMVRKHYGTIKLGKSVILSDPCYKPGIWCSSEIEDMNPGIYDCYVDMIRHFNSTRVARLTITPAESNKVGFSYDTKVKDFLAVDAGVFGIYDKDYFIQKKTQEPDEWYSENVVSWCGEDLAFICSEGKGIISSSGYGDGVYDAFLSKNEQGLVDSIMAVFIYPEDDLEIIEEVNKETTEKQIIEILKNEGNE